METSPPDAKLIEGLQAFAKDVGGVPTVRGMRNDGPYSPHYYKQAFGSWHDALRAADIQPTHGVELDVDREELLDDLQRVANQCNGPPRRREVDEFGEYPYDAYDEEFDSFIRALEAVGIEPTEKQYRFSSVETPEHKKGSANIEKLRTDGPTPGAELPNGMSAKDRELGMWKFDMSSGSTQPADPIYYLDDEHAPELVLRRFFKYNPHVLEYRAPHGIKMEIGNHKPSWKDRGQEIVDELVERGVTDHSLQRLVLVDLTLDETLEYCFEQSVLRSVDTNKIPFDDQQQVGSRPVWGFQREYEDAWESLSRQDGILFSTEPDVYTHYIPVGQTVVNSDVMTELWVEYDESGVRSGGISQPLPNIVIGTECIECNLPREELVTELNCEIHHEAVQSLDGGDIAPLTNSYGRFQVYLSERDHIPDLTVDGVDLDGDLNVDDAMSALLEFAMRDLPIEQVESQVEKIDREVRREAFRKAIKEVYTGCAVCGLRREAPNGAIDLEAAHIVPKHAGGPDIIQNGLALCSNHHWAYDNGWFEISTEYEITIQGSPGLEGYEELQQHHQDRLDLPSQTDIRPHPHYIRERTQHMDTTSSIQ